jgi:hypothetical protein
MRKQIFSPFFLSHNFLSHNFLSHAVDHTFLHKPCALAVRGKTATVLALLLALLLLVGWQPVQAATEWYVTPTGAGNRDGSSPENALRTIQAALDRAQPGDTINLGPGDYFEDLTTKTHGTATARITLTGPRTAVLRGAGGARVFQIFHDYYVLDGWTINGHDGNGNSQSDYRDKLLYVHGQRQYYQDQIKRGPTGLEVKNMLITNGGGECIRLRYFVTYANIHHNEIRNCGVHDFRFNAGGKNGEGIYIGTSSNQWNDGKNPSAHPDNSAYNHIHHNVFDTAGNECVEVKEGGEANLIEDNDCRGGKDPESGGLASRGSNNTFANNKSYDHAGGGFRVGGHEMNGVIYGINNHIYGNTIANNAAGGIKFQRAPQGTICGNIFQNQPNPSFGDYGTLYINQVAAPCTNVPPTPTTPPTVTPPTVTPTVTQTPVPPTPTTPPTTPTVPTPPITATPVTPVPPNSDFEPQKPAAQIIYLSSSTDGTIGDLQFRDEDIVGFDLTSHGAFLAFDGSDVGITVDLDAFAWGADGTLLLSLQEAATVPGVGKVDDSDILHFTPTVLGRQTTGSFSLYFDGSAVGLTADGEDVDGLEILEDGRLLLSTRGDVDVPGLEGKNEDLLLFTPIRLGDNSAGTFTLYFDGSDLNAPAIGMDNWSVAVGAGGKLYITTESAAIGANDDSVDLFECTLTSLGANTVCPLQLFWDGYLNGFGDIDERIDGFDLDGQTSATILFTDRDASDPQDGVLIDVGLADRAWDDYAPVDSTDDEPEPEELDSFLEIDRASNSLQRIYLPLINR